VQRINVGEDWASLINIPPPASSAALSSNEQSVRIGEPLWFDAPPPFEAELPRNVHRVKVAAEE
jgi:hypothetical protein